MLLQVQDIKTDGRPISEYIDPSRVEIYIQESELLDLKPQIGDALYLNILQWIEKKDTERDYETLLGGGTYTNACGETRQFVGLKKALNYYVQARIVKNNNYNQTRFGLTRKKDAHSEAIALNEVLALEKDMRNVADRYMQDCLIYLRENKANYPLFKRGGQQNRLQITIAGK